MKAHQIHYKKSDDIRSILGLGSIPSNSYPMYVVYKNRVVRISGPAERSEISQELEFEEISDSQMYSMLKIN